MTSTQLACPPPGEPKCPQPVASSTNEPCVVTCGDSRVIIFPPPVVVTFPGPILTTYPQQTLVGASEPPEVPLPAEGAAGSGDRASAPRCAPKYSYSYASQWTHPCRSQRAGKRWNC